MKGDFMSFGKKFYWIILIIALVGLFMSLHAADNKGLALNDQDYFEMPGLNVLVFHNTFSEGHQGGLEIIQHENRVATNGEIRINATPGQWQPTAKLGEGLQKRGVSPQTLAVESRKVNRKKNEISIPCSYPDESLNRQGFNPIIYPDLNIKYTIRVKAKGQSIFVTVDFDEPIPEDWVGRIGYNLELFPGNLYGKHYYMDGKSGIFPRQPEGEARLNQFDEAEAPPMAEGQSLIVAPESDLLRMKIESKGSQLVLLDGSLQHNNGWFVVRSLVPRGATKKAIEWVITPHVMPGFKYEPVIHISQVGYHPDQKKIAYIELDKRETDIRNVILYKVSPDGKYQTVVDQKPKEWGQYLRYKYALLDFSDVKESGIYLIKYGNQISNSFQIGPDVYKHNVWQPTLDYFVPIQMCHMRVNQKYRVWHGACHMDDALMMPLNIRHFDGYNNEGMTSNLTKYKPLEHVPGLNIGGWHDAGDYDLRVESQAQAVMMLAQAYEEFGINWDNTFVDQENHHVEIHQPDGKPDLLQQVEHGVLAILSGYRQFGRLYRGIICPTLRQYVMLGDGSTMTDGKVFDDQGAKVKAANLDEMWYKKVANRYSKVFDPELNAHEIQAYVPELDDRLVFTDDKADLQLVGATALAIGARVLKGYNDALAEECLTVAEALYATNKDQSTVSEFMGRGSHTNTLCELIITTNSQKYKDELCGMEKDAIAKDFQYIATSIARVLPHIDCEEFKSNARAIAEELKPELDKMMNETPFGCPTRTPEYLGYNAYYLHKAWPDLFSPDYLFSVVNFLLGCRPGSTTNSLVSGVGAKSPTIAYGTNRADWSYIPGGTFWAAVNLVRPDFPEDKEWPFIWQEREYIIGGACAYMFIVLAADHLLNGN
ncbi:MAG: glycoside hydrolase family 9 protein [Candidatus Marinimicrobia bacterium]|nr:glycoside hydrolase family 9 protein [Candidatus Neomarinimicrobiota bacterium]